MTSIYPWLTPYIPLLVALAGVLLVVLVGLIVWLALRLRRVENTYRVLTEGTNAGSLEAVLEDHVRQVRQAMERVTALDELTHHIERSNRSHIQRLGFLRFNPFRDSGGDQSFAVALADQGGNGVVISGLHGRDATRVYAKPLATWESVYPLTDEERQAIRIARGEAAIS
jgi:uncharacterized protein YheU (UPF0270 family)